MNLPAESDKPKESPGFLVKNKDVITITISTFGFVLGMCGFGLSAWYYGQVVRNMEAKSQAEADQRELQRASEIFSSLESSESRYRLLNPSSMVITKNEVGDSSPQKLHLEIPVLQVDGKEIPHFSLPRTRITEQRVRQVEVDGKLVTQEYTIQRLGSVIRGQNFSPFNCVDCNSSYRLQLYLEAREIEKTTKKVLSPESYIRLIRAAVDVGKFDLAITFIKKLRKEYPPEALDRLELARLEEQLGKTLLIMGRYEEGFQSLRTCRRLYKQATIDPRAVGLHDILLWEAQFACTLGDSERAQGLLEEMASTVYDYQLSASKKSQIVEDGYASCMSILADFQITETVFKIPVQFQVYVQEKGWCSPYKIVASTDRDSPLPPPLLWDIQDLPQPSPDPFLKSILER